jgi:hypothetical protein
MAAIVYMVLRLPFYHLHFHPIEFIGAELKAWVGTINNIYI